MDIRRIQDDEVKKTVSRAVLEDLTDWFGIPEYREEYIENSAGKPFFAAYDGGRPVGFLYLKQTGRDTVELAVMGVLREYHRRGIGRQLVENAKALACAGGYGFLQVKTVKMGTYEEFDRTNMFYLSLGFREFEVFPSLWDEHNPCQVYVMALDRNGAGNGDD